MAVIRVPKTPKTAFDRNRRASSLLLKQIEHLEWAALPASQRKPGQLPRRRVKTEAQAADRVGQLTKMITAARAAEATATAKPGQPPGKPVLLPPIPPLPPRESAARTHGRRLRGSAGRGRGTRR